jgi:DNA polymerase-3 subunit delta
MLHKQFTREIEKGLPHSLYFLCSSETFFLEEALYSVVDTVVPVSQRDFNYDVFNSSSSAQQIIDTSYSFPFLAARRLVVIRDFHQFSAQNVKILVPYLKNPSETTCMTILSQKDPKKSISADWRIFHLRLRESDIPAWIRQRASMKGMKISASAVDHLLESLGPDIGLLASEIEKLYVSGLKNIEDRDIISGTGMMKEYTPFNLIDAITAGKRTKAFKILRSLLAKKSSDATAVLGPLNWHYRLFYNLWENRGNRPLKMKSETYRTLMRHLPSMNAEHFGAIFQYLHEADIRVKSSGRPELALEILLIRLLQVGSGS